MSEGINQQVTTITVALESSVDCEHDQEDHANFVLRTIPPFEPKKNLN